MNERSQRLLEAYCDDELDRLRRAWCTWRIRRSPDWRRELEAIARFSRQIQDHEEETVSEGGSLWPEISLGLAAVDARVAAQAEAPAQAHPAWRRIATPLAAGAAVFAVALWLWEAPTPTPELLSPVQGAVRYLDTDGQPVLLVEDPEGVTIIWMMDGSGPGGV